MTMTFGRVLETTLYEKDREINSYTRVIEKLND